MALTAEQQALDYPELQDVGRQRKLADLLMASGLQQPQGQMISGRYVAPSFTQQLNPLANILAGQAIGERADTKQNEMAMALRVQGDKAAQEVMQAYKQDPQLALAKASQYQQYPQVKALLPQLSKVALPEATTLEREFIAVKNQGYQGNINDFKNQMSKYQESQAADAQKRLILDEQKFGLDKQRLGIAQQQLAYDTGIGMGGNPSMAAGGQGGQFAPKTTPQYEYNPSLSPKQNQEAAGKFYENMQKNVTNAKDSFDLMKSASDILKSNAPSSGRGENIITGAREFFGGGGEASKADASLNMLSGALTMKQPRFEGPQGVLDVTLYQKLAGDLGNPNIPVPSRLGTMKQMVDLQKKYYPNADWDSIKTELDSASKVSLGAAPQYARNPETGERRMSTDGGKTWKPVR
jgi:hypothetical protein